MSTSSFSTKPRRAARPSRRLTAGAFAVGLVALCVLGGALIVVAAPHDELGEATSALDQAREADAAVLAPEPFARAEHLLAEGRAEFERQEQQALPLRNHLAARRLLQEAEATAARAADEAANASREIRRTAETHLADAERALDTAAASLERAPRGHDTQDELRAARRDLVSLEADLAGAESALRDDDPQRARAQAERVERRAAALTDLVERSMAPRR